MPVLLSSSRWNDTPGLTFPVGEISLVIDHDVARFSRGFWPNDAFGGDNLSRERGFIFVHVDGDGGMVILGW